MTAPPPAGWKMPFSPFKSLHLLTPPSKWNVSPLPPMLPPMPPQAPPPNASRPDTSGSASPFRPLPRANNHFPSRTLRRRARRGMLLIEMIAYLAIMAALSLLATEMVVTSTRMARESTQRDIMLHRIDTALGTLRQDVWSAQAITATSDQIALVQSDGVVFWHLENGGKLTRYTATELPYKRTWIDMPPLVFAARGATLHVEVAAEGAPHEQITLVSQPLLAGGQP